jgi:hypothetical protein
MLDDTVDSVLLRHTFPESTYPGRSGRPVLAVLEESAWHCSWFINASDGGAQDLVTKLKSLAAVELDRDDMTSISRLEYVVREGRGLVYEEELLKVPPENCTREHFPRLVWGHMGRYRHWLKHCFRGREFLSDDGQSSVSESKWGERPKMRHATEL